MSPTCAKRTRGGPCSPNVCYVIVDAHLAFSTIYSRHQLSCGHNYCAATVDQCELGGGSLGQFKFNIAIFAKACGYFWRCAHHCSLLLKECKDGSFHDIWNRRICWRLSKILHVAHMNSGRLIVSRMAGATHRHVTMQPSTIQCCCHTKSWLMMFVFIHTVSRFNLYILPYF